MAHRIPAKMVNCPTLALYATLLAFGCSNGSRSESTDAASPLVIACHADSLGEGANAQSSQGELSAELTALDPSVPSRGDNRWQLHLTNGQGDALVGADPRISLWMPEHSHGGLKTALIDDLGAGNYSAEPISFHMPGLWEVTVSVANEQAVFEACVAP